jgi:hypothetical protein
MLGLTCQAGRDAMANAATSSSEQGSIQPPKTLRDDPSVILHRALPASQKAAKSKPRPVGLDFAKPQQKAEKQNRLEGLLLPVSDSWRSAGPLPYAIPTPPPFHSFIPARPDSQIANAERALPCFIPAYPTPPEPPAPDLFMSPHPWPKVCPRPLSHTPPNRARPNPPASVCRLPSHRLGAWPARLNPTYT